MTSKSLHHKKLARGTRKTTMGGKMMLHPTAANAGKPQPIPQFNNTYDSHEDSFEYGV